MSQRTLTKQDRMYDWDKDQGYHRRLEIKPPKPPSNAGNCYWCHEPVFVSQGQIINMAIVDGVNIPTHKKCRKANQ